MSVPDNGAPSGSGAIRVLTRPAMAGCIAVPAPYR